MHWLSWKPLCEPSFFYVLCVFALRITSGRSVKLAGPVVYSTDHSKAMVPVLVLTVFKLVDISHHIGQSFDNKQISCMVFCDISKAFDRIT